jgi:ATP-dependent protease HslVU (ClpYQ) peptidase subunit
MSCVVGIREPNGKIWMGADTLITIGDEIRKAKTRKIVRGKDFIVGIVGDFSIRNFFDEKFVFPKTFDEFIKQIKNYSVENHLVGAEDEEENQYPDMVNYSLLVAWKKKLYHVLYNFAYIEYEDDYIAIGSGANYALGSLYTIYNIKETLSMTTESTIYMALDAASEYRGDVGGNLMIASI